MAIPAVGAAGFFWGKFAAVLAWVLSAVTAHIIAKVLITLGVSFVTFVGIGQVLDLVYAKVDELWLAMGATPGLETAVALLGLLQLDTIIDLLLAAYSGRLTFMGMAAGGGLTRIVHRFQDGGA
jgi:hypothetical protein